MDQMPKMVDMGSACSLL